MANMINFNFKESLFRVVILNDAPWFAAKDVCFALELGNVGQALSRLDEDERSSVRMMTLGGMQNVAIVNESGLFNLILGSRKEEAKKFKKWVTSEVLPSIRKTGSYSVNGSKIPLHLLRYIENENMLPKGHFSVLTEMIRHFYGKLAAMGAPEHELEKMYADTSMGIGFSDFLKKQNIDVSALPTYNHKTPWGKVVPAKAYPLRYAEVFSDYILNEWMPKKAQKYIAEKAPSLLPYLPKLLS